MLPATKRGKELATSFSVLLLVVSMFVAGEILLRFDQWNRNVISHAAEDVTSDISATGHIKNVNLENLGFRGQDVDISKPAGMIRIVFLGSSTTRELYATEESVTWPYITWESLSNLFPTCNFEYINAGQNGFGVNANLELYRARISALEPDIVVLTPNDMIRDLRNLALATGAMTINKIEDNFLYRNSVLWQHLSVNLTRVKQQQRADRSKMQYPPADEFVKPFTDRLMHFIRTVQEDGRIPVLVFIPKMIRKNQDHETRVTATRRAYLDLPFMDIDKFIEYSNAVHDAILDVGKSTGTPVVDARGHIPDDTVHYVDTYHLAPAGSKILGQLVASTLTDTRYFHRTNHEAGSGCKTD